MTTCAQKYIPYAALILCAVSLIVLTVTPLGRYLRNNQRHYSIMSVDISPNIEVTAHAIAKANIHEDFPVTEELLENILANNQDALPTYITKVIVTPEGFFTSDTYERKMYFEIITREKEKILFVFKTADNELHYAYLKERPQGDLYVLSDGAPPNSSTSTPAYHYAGARIMKYPVFSMNDIETTFRLPTYPYLNDDISVMAEFVTHIPDHHDTFHHDASHN